MLDARVALAFVEEVLVDAQVGVEAGGGQHRSGQRHRRHPRLHPLQRVHRHAGFLGSTLTSANVFVDTTCSSVRPSVNIALPTSDAIDAGLFSLVEIDFFDQHLRALERLFDFGGPADRSRASARAASRPEMPRRVRPFTLQKKCLGDWAGFGACAKGHGERREAKRQQCCASTHGASNSVSGNRQTRRPRDL